MNDTIAAVATGGGRTAIGIVRLSGPEAVSAADALFRPAFGAPLRERQDRQLVYGALTDGSGAVIDHILATVTRGPGSYTGEDTAELQCHGSPAVLSLALEGLFQRGVRQAKAGEFTRRAFLNGRMDLPQAEAVADLIDAETAAAVKCAAGRLGGALSRRIEGVYDTLTDLTAHFCAVLDYPDEDLDPFDRETIATALSSSARQLEELRRSYRRGKLISQGVACAIVGKPNVGKSSLLNALLGYDRAIVTPVAGTTRDTIEEKLTIGGVLLRLIDTAGLRETSDEVEKLGVERSRKALESAELALAVVDPRSGLDDEDRELLRLACQAPRCVVVCNKSDLPAAVPPAKLNLPEGVKSVELSARTGEGMEELERAIADLFPEGEGDDLGELLTNARQAEAAARAEEAVSRASAALKSGLTPDAVLTDVEEAMTALGELTGKSVHEDITDRIFSRFCVGK